MFATLSCVPISFMLSTAVLPLRYLPTCLLSLNLLTDMLQYEIRTNPETVDLLVSIAYTAAADQVLEDPLPIGMGLRVSVPDPKRCVLVPTTTFASVMPGAVVPPVLTPIQAPPIPGPDGLCEFDEMGILEVSEIANNDMLNNCVHD